MTNLNELEVYGLDDWMSKDDKSKFRQKHHTSKDESVSVFFRDLETHLVDQIEKHSIVVGCVAWLTNQKILDALSNKQKVSIVIQKEDFLRPDTGTWSGEKLRNLYSKLPIGATSPINGLWWGDIVGLLNLKYIWESEPVRWMGNFNNEKSSAFPRMHNKFMVFCETVLKDDMWHVKPVAVWTGSFNMTSNATRSLENAVLIRDEIIANAYFDEWQHIFSLSESIPSEYWDHHKWDFPKEFYVGT